MHYLCTITILPQLKYFKLTKYCVNVTLHLVTDGIDRTLFLPPRYLSCVSKIDTIIFPTYNNDGKNEIRQVNRDEAFKKILSNIRSHNNMINLFNTCKQLIRGCTCFELQHTNSENACVMIEKEVYNETLEI